jgi:ribosomal protein S18 acetylase RimI-like enzyme
MIVRRATEADALDVLAWRNDPLTRAMSRHRDEIDEASHLAWFAGALANPQVTLLIGEAEGEKVGMVRFDHLEPTEVSINVNPACRGRGHGYALLTGALEQVRGDVVAEILEENLASQRLFERAGFTLQRKIDGRRSYLRAG